MQILRANAESVGDYDAQKAFMREEMEATREHLRRARIRQDPYYREKYKGIKPWLAVRKSSLLLWLDRHLLGHGERLGRAAVGSASLLIIIAVLLFLSTQSWANDPTASSVLRHFWLCTLYVLYTLLDVPTDIALGEVKAFVVVILLLRYFLIGVLVASLSRLVSHR
jgi:hypothetical protein